MLLVGYFNTFDKVKYGIDKKKRPYLGFIPFNSKYKKIKITYSGKQKGKLLAQVELINLEEFPTGIIKILIGKYSTENIIPLLLTMSENKIRNLEIKNLEINKNKLEIYKKDFLTIDPEGSTDLDDGFNLDYPILDVIIASPVFYLDSKIILDKYLESVSSLYYSKTEHLWGNKINEKCSLLKGNETVILVLSYNLISEDYTLDFKIGKNTNQLTYNYFDKKMLYKFDILKEHFNYNNSKELVQEIMILTNKKLTEYFEKKKLSIFYRIFNVIDNFIELEIPKKVKDIFNQRKSESAIYSLRMGEHKLMNGKYSHFTSPLRRWVDCFHQLILYNYKYNKILDYKIDEDLLNYKFKKVRKFHLEYNYLVENIVLDFEKEYYGYIYNLKSNNLNVWCDKINRFIKIEIINKNLLYQLNINYNESEKNWEIYDKINDKITKYKLGELIKFKLKYINSLIPSKCIIGILE